MAESIYRQPISDKGKIPANNMAKVLPNPQQYMAPLMASSIKHTYNIPGYSSSLFSLFQKPSKGTYNVPIKDVINAQANDKGYYDKAVTDMSNYLSNSGKWYEKLPGVWHSKDNGTTFDFNKWKTNANSNASVNMVSTLSPMYITPYTGSGPLTDTDDTIRYDQVQLNPLAVKHSISGVQNATSRPGPWANTGSADNALHSTKYLTDIQNLGLVGGHEINHKLMEGVFQGMVPKGYSYSGRKYALMPSEHFPAAAKFHRQYYANTGKTITPENFWESIDTAKQNIGDYDSESRRFLENTEYQRRNKNTNQHANQMLDATINNIPLFRGGNATPYGK